MNETKTDTNRAIPEVADSAADDLLFIDEVADWTRIPANTLKHYRRTGSGPHSAIVGGKIRYRRGDVRAWLNDQFASSEAGPVAS